MYWAVLSELYNNLKVVKSVLVPTVLISNTRGYYSSQHKGGSAAIESSLLPRCS